LNKEYLLGTSYLPSPSAPIHNSQQHNKCTARFPCFDHSWRLCITQLLSQSQSIVNWKEVASPSLFHVEMRPRKKGDAAEKEFRY